MKIPLKRQLPRKVSKISSAGRLLPSMTSGGVNVATSGRARIFLIPCSLKSSRMEAPSKTWPPHHRRQHSLQFVSIYKHDCITTDHSIASFQKLDCPMLLSPLKLLHQLRQLRLYHQ